MKGWKQFGSICRVSFCPAALSDEDGRMRTRLTTVSKICPTSFTRPGIAVSGHTVQQLPQAVQFSGTNSGWWKRIWVMSRNRAEQAGITPRPMKGSVRLSLPMPRA